MRHEARGVRTTETGAGAPHDSRLTTHSRDLRLRRSAEFDRARAAGRSWSHPLLVCYASARDDTEPSRVGFIVGRRVGKAVVRNRVRRRLREAMRALFPTVRPGQDVVLIARPPASQASYIELLAALRSLLGRAGALEPAGDKQGNSP